MKERILTCIVCPRGCTLRVRLDDSSQVLRVEGNACLRGVGYAEDECTHPRRTVTSTVRTEKGRVVAVKTDGAVPKELVFEVMKRINSVTAPDTLDIGDIVIEDVLGTGINVVATSRSNG